MPGIMNNGNESFDVNMIFNRTARLLGDSVMDALKNTRVIVFGVGGVGSWAAEALARTGIGHLTIVDADDVSVTNINRQAEATVETAGMVKVSAMEQILKSVNPDLDLRCIQGQYNQSTAGCFNLEEYDYVIDAIDSLSDKALLIRMATAASHPVLFSSMGAALKLDPTKIRTAEFWQVEGCPLAAALRRRFRKSNDFPSKKFKCVYSPELLKNKGEISSTDSAMTYNKVAVNGSLCHITAIFGMILAGLVIEDIVRIIERS